MERNNKVTTDYIIEVLKSKGYSHEQSVKIEQKAITTGTLTCFLMDVVDSFIKDYLSLLKEIGAKLPPEKEKNLKEMRKSYNHFHKHMAAYTNNVFRIKSALSEKSEDYSSDLYDIVKLIADHTNTRKDMEQIKKSIERRKLNHHIFNEEQQCNGNGETD